jgi:alpha/beta superfamily hydrolase
MTNTTATGGWVCFNHGKESGPWGVKITRLAEVAREQGFAVVSPDYSHSPDPAARVRQLLALPRPAQGPRVLVGSSMGGYVAAQACAAIRPEALLPMAPALYFPGWDEEPDGIPAETVVVHGWGDEVVPVDRALRFATRHAAALHLFRAGHGLSEVLEDIAALFERQLRRVRGAPR